MKKVMLMIVIALFAAFSVLVANENDKMRIGLTIDYDYSYSDYNIDKQYDIDCPFCSYVAGEGYSFGLTTRFPISFLSGSLFKSMFDVNLEYSNHSASKIKPDNEYPSLVDEPSVETFYSSYIKYNYKINYSAVGLSLNYSVFLFNTNFLISIGAGYDYALTNNYKLTANLIGNDDSKIDTMLNLSCWEGKIIKYADDKRSASILNEPISDINDFRLFFNFGLGYDFYINDFIISPTIKFKTDSKLIISKFGFSFYF